MAKLTALKWLNTLIGMFVQGGATSLVATCGSHLAPAVGWEVRPLDPDQMMIVFLGGAVFKAAKFLEKSPVPNFGADLDDETTITQKHKRHKHDHYKD